MYYNDVQDTKGVYSNVNMQSEYDAMRLELTWLQCMNFWNRLIYEWKSC